MRLRRARTPEGELVTAVWSGERWDALPGVGVLDVLGGQAGEPRPEPAELDLAPVLPFEPRSFRDFSVFEQHMIGSARVLAKNFMPDVAGTVIGGFERVSGRTFPKLKPPPLFYEHPPYYMGNHTAFITEGDTVRWPGYCEWLDYELELGFVIAREVRDATPEEGLAAIGGFFVVNDWSARDTQWDEYDRGVFGPVIKAKGFANSMGAEVVTADEVLEGGALRGTVRINGEQRGSSTTAGMSHSFGDMVAYASQGETLAPGDVLATGTFTGCCGLERDERLAEGDEVSLEIERVGTLTNTVGARGR